MSDIPNALRRLGRAIGEYWSARRALRTATRKYREMCHRDNAALLLMVCERLERIEREVFDE